MEPVVFMTYEKMSDDLMYLSNNVVLRFNINLASYNKDGKRSFFHKEYEYKKNGSTVTTLRRHYDYFLTIENVSVTETGLKEFIIISIKDFLRFKTSIETCVKWFQDDKYKNLYAMKKHELIMTSPIPTCELNGLPMGKYIKYDPIIIDNGLALNDKKPGIAITLSNPNNFIMIDVDTLMGLYYIIKDLNMISMAQSMLSYLAPQYPINRVNMNTYTSVPSGRFINPNADDNSKEIKNIQNGNNNDIRSTEGRRITPKKEMKDLE